MLQWTNKLQDCHYRGNWAALLYQYLERRPINEAMQRYLRVYFPVIPHPDLYGGNVFGVQNKGREKEREKGRKKKEKNGGSGVILS